MKRSKALALAIASLGLSYAPAGAEPLADEPPKAEAAKINLEDSAQWKHLVSTWREAGEIAAGAKGAYPFTADEKKQLEAELAAVAQDINQLQSAGLLAEPEAALLKLDLPPLVAKVQAFRTKGMEMATCYRPMGLPAPTAHVNLAQRLPLLKKMIETKAVRRAVLSRSIQGIEADLKLLSDPTYLARYTKVEDRQNAIRMRDDAQAQVDKIKEILNESKDELQSSAQWKTITAAWKEAAPLAQTHQSTTKQRESAKRNLDAAAAAAGELAAKGLLTDAEAGLLSAEAQSLFREICRDRPTDSMITCYDMAYMPAAGESLDHLAKRLPLLRKLAENGRVQSAVIEKVLPSIEEDLRVLSDEGKLKELAPEKRKEAEAARKEAAIQVEQIRQIIEREKAQ